MKEVKLLHSTNNRARFYFGSLNKILNISEFIFDLEKNKNINEVRINQKAKSVVFAFKDLEISFLKDLLENLEISKYLSSATFLSVDENKSEESKPSLKGVYKSSSVMLLEPLLKNDLGKMFLTSFAVRPLLIDGIKEFFKEGLTSRVLEATAVGVSFVRKDYLAANSTNALLELGEYIEETTVHRSDDLIKELAKPNVEQAWIEKTKDGKKVQEKIKTALLKVGDIVVVRTGDTIAIDGHIIHGKALVNQVSMTGEAQGVEKSRGDRVISGTIVSEGTIKIWAEQVGDNTATARIKNYIKNSLDEKSKIGLKASKLADKLVPITLGLAGFSYLISRDFKNVASVLQADYSCALKLATPVAFKSSISQAGRNGAMIKGAKSIENLALADTFVFDKTGTLTKGQLIVESVISFDKDWSEEELLNLSASAEEHYFHPVAEAIVNAAKNQGFVHMHHEEVEFIVAHGVKTSVKEKEVIIGSRHFLEDDEKIDFSKYEEQIKKLLMNGNMVLYVGYGKKLLGVISLKDTLRENAKASILKLKSLGVKEIIMLTGDIESKAKEIANELGIDRYYANVLPTQKAQVVKELKDEGKHVAFVGDGINDAPALISANVGISMHKGADIAKATADIGLLKDDIALVADLKELSNKTLSRIDRNFKATVGINSLILISATFGFLNPISTAVLHNGTTIGLLINSLRKIGINKINNTNKKKI